MIVAVDIFGLILSLAALTVILVNRKKGLRIVDFAMLVGVLFLTVIINLGNALEWSGITGIFDTFEEYLEAGPILF